MSIVVNVSQFEVSAVVVEIYVIGQTRSRSCENSLEPNSFDSHMIINL